MCVLPSLTSGSHHHNLRVAMARRFVVKAAASCQCRFQHTNFSLSLHLVNLCNCKGADSRLKITWFEQYPLGHNNRLLLHLQRSIYIYIYIIKAKTGGHFFSFFLLSFSCKVDFVGEELPPMQLTPG